LIGIQKHHQKQPKCRQQLFYKTKSSKNVETLRTLNIHTKIEKELAQGTDLLTKYRAEWL
jgi:hypothetical protein